MMAKYHINIDCISHDANELEMIKNRNAKEEEKQLQYYCFEKHSGINIESEQNCMIFR